MVDFRSELIQLGFGQWDLLAAVSLLLLEFNRLLLLLHLLLLIHLLANHASCLILEKACGKHTHHVLLFRKGWGGLELFVNGLDYGCKARCLGVPALDCRSFVLDRDWIERGVSDSRHHVDLWRDLRERRVESHLDIERCR